MFKTNLDPQKASLMGQTFVGFYHLARRKPKRWWRNLGGQGLKILPWPFPDPETSSSGVCTEKRRPPPQKKTDNWVGFSSPINAKVGKSSSSNFLHFQVLLRLVSGRVSTQKKMHPLLRNGTLLGRFLNLKKKHQHEPPNHPFGWNMAIRYPAIETKNLDLV